jgi:UMP-CMP kinase
MANDELEFVAVLGRPGSGKGTACRRIAEEFGYVHISVGELLRQERENPESPYRELIDKQYSADTVVLPDIVCILIETAVEKSKPKKKFLFDAFALNMKNIESWNKTELSKKMKLSFVLFLDCPQEVCEERILDRGAAGSGRDDDVADKLETRFTRYEQETVQVIQHFNDQGLLRQVDGSQSADEVCEGVRMHFQTG